MKNQVQLITYVDRLGGGGLKELRELLEGPLRGVFGGVHLLPFFHPIDGADAGFDPIDHTQVDARLGDWQDIAALSQHTAVMADVIVNHVSAESPQFRDYVERGAASPYAGMFLTRDAVFPAAQFPDGPNAAQLAAIYRPRPGLPFTEVTVANGRRELLWTTFTPRQIDIDVRHRQGRAYLARILQIFAQHGIRMVRLDAAGYAIKQAGTSCFMLPETFAFISDFGRQADEHGIEVLVEIHAPYRKQIEVSAAVAWVYDFALPPLLLHAHAFRTAACLKHWIRIRPRNAITVLDTHDGIGIIDVGGLVPAAELDRLVDLIHERTGDESRRATGASASNLDLYQVNCTYYDAMGRDNDAYLLARAIQFFLPGVPQVYYVGLLAGHNDMALLARSGAGRDINRHYYNRAEVEAQLRTPVVASLVELIRLRNEHPAFDGRFELGDTSAERLALSWRSGAHHARLDADFSNGSWLLRASVDGGASPDCVRMSSAAI